MKNTNKNQNIIVTAVGFDKDMTVFPKRIEIDGAVYCFVDAGLRCLVETGSKIVSFFTLSDGEADFYLRNDDVGWTLLSVLRRSY